MVFHRRTKLLQKSLSMIMNERPKDLVVNNLTIWNDKKSYLFIKIVTH